MACSVTLPTHRRKPILIKKTNDSKKKYFSKILVAFVQLGHIPEKINF
jgi:hypothetical protein